MKRLVPVFALLVAFSGVMIYVLRARESTPAESAPAPGPAATEKAPETTGEPAAQEPEKKPSKRRGIVVSAFAEGSLTDANAPLSALAKYEAIRAAELAKWEVTMDLSSHDKPLREILTSILREYGVKVGVDPGVDAENPITFMVKDLPGKHCLRLLLQQYDLVWVIDENGESWAVPENKKALYEPEAWRAMVEMQEVAQSLASEERLGVVPEPDQNLNNLIDSIKISLDFSETPLPEVVSFISEVSQVSVVVERRQIEDPDTTGLTFKVQDATLRDALTSALDSVGLGFYVQNGLLVVTTKEEIARLDKRRAEFEEQRALAVKEEAEILDRWVTLTGENLAIREVADLLSKATGIGYVIDTPTWNRAARLSFDGEPHTLREIFAAMASGAPVRVAYREGRLWFLDRPAPQEAK